MSAAYRGDMSSDAAVTIATRHGGDAGIGSVAALIGERARARVLIALLDGNGSTTHSVYRRTGINGKRVGEGREDLRRGGGDGAVTM